MMELFTFYPMRLPKQMNLKWARARVVNANLIIDHLVVHRS